MRIHSRRTARAAATVALAASLGAVGAQAAGTASAAPAKKASAVTACTTANLKLTVTDVQRPVNHLLLKAVNTGTKTCAVYHAPYLRMGADAQSPTQWLEESKPQAVVTLKPGKAAYAAVGTWSPDGVHDTTVTTMGVLLAAKAQNGSAGKEKTLKLPNGGVVVNSAAFVTYWQGSAADALVW